jgi:hypothetical protein
MFVYTNLWIYEIKEFDLIWFDNKLARMLYAQMPRNGG